MSRGIIVWRVTNEGHPRLESSYVPPTQEWKIFGGPPLILFFIEDAFSSIVTPFLFVF